MRSGWASGAIALVLLLAGGCAQEADPEDARLADVIEASERSTSTGEPQSYGDDPRLDEMQDDCESGELLACDLLYLESPEGSDYERVAVTCGGTSDDEGTFCTPHPEIDESGFAPEGSAGLQPLGTQCKDGNLTACDVLFLIVPDGHELQDVAFTCGGRVEDGAFPDCRTALG